jgi:hypothetical protein
LWANIFHKYIFSADGIAKALAPQMQDLDPESADIIDTNMGFFGSEAQPMVDGAEEVLRALSSYVAASDIDCELLTVQDLCGMTLSPNITEDGVMPSPTPLYEGTANPTTIIGDLSIPDEIIPFPCRYAADGGIPPKTLIDDPPALVGGLYQPKSYIDHM